LAGSDRSVLGDDLTGGHVGDQQPAARLNDGDALPDEAGRNRVGVPVRIVS
ncbi:MAG: hypothetical protein JWN52_1897, partial [Actinomycetia bacterium]|nr:hypothetical protein [Actinomycetes bacterium]